MDHQAFAQLLGNYGEFLGAIAVVVTLGYLAAQIRQNTRASYASAQQTIQHELNRLHEQIMGNKEFAELVARCGDPSPAEPSPVDDVRMQSFANFYLNTYATIETAYNEGQFNPYEFNNYCEDFRRVLAMYPALLPKMRTIMEPFSEIRANTVIFKPLWE